jgi:tetratricopeptide (TPR) repeat protein
VASHKVTEGDQPSLAWVTLMYRLPLLIVVAIISTTAPVLANDEQDCFQSQEPQLRIKGCSEIIQRAPNDATAYHNRAVAHGLAGDIDSAIADYTKVIEIAPNTASAYENRGRAYASKGDYASALADETKASELIAKATAQPAEITPKKSKKPKAPKTTASITKGTTVPPKSKAGANVSTKVGKEAPDGSWWSWLWGGNADQAGGKKAKP